jgi:predicted nucleic-acid-binding protein
VQVRTPTVKDGFANDERVASCKRQVFQKCGFATPTHLVEETLTARRKVLEEQAKHYRESLQNGGDSEKRRVRE